MMKQRVLWLLCLLWLTGCDFMPTSPKNRAPFNPADYYYLLSENPPRIVEISQHNKLEQRIFLLSSRSLGSETPEGLAYVPNQDVAQYGLFDLPPSANGGYFIVATQQRATLHVFDVPLATASSGQQLESIQQQNIGGLEKDVSDLYYDQGEIWLTVAQGSQLFRLSTAINEDGLVTVTAVYDLSQLPHGPIDIEGITFGDANTVFFADDRAQVVSRYDNFPACLEDASCTPAWSYVYGAIEPSGAIWQTTGRNLLIVDDEGALLRFDPESGADKLIMYTSLDLEAITLIPSLP